LSLFLDIGTGAGLSSATGVRPYLPPLLAGGLARGDIGIDFDGTDFSFLESTAFLAAIVAIGVIAFFVERSVASRARADKRRGRPRDPSDVLALLLGLGFGALLFAGALADNGHESWLGLMLGPFCALLGWIAIGGMIERVRNQIGPVAAFKLVAAVARLPKTRSGKILRGTMKALADRKPYKTPATIDDPAILPEIELVLQRLGYATAPAAD